jgi:endo-1,4-beta-xylanase
LEAFGSGYIGRALTQARIFAPRAQLIINEYGLEYDFAEERERRYFLLKLLERLRHENAPLDGLGLQGHLDLRKGNISQSAIADFLQEVADMGLFIDVTELDVTEADRSAPLVERDRLVADEVSRYLEVVLSQPNVRGVTTWGLTDRRSWLNGNGPALNRGLPFDASMQPTSMYFAIREAFGSAAGSSGH